VATLLHDDDADRSGPRTGAVRARLSSRLRPRGARAVFALAGAISFAAAGLAGCAKQTVGAHNPYLISLRLTLYDGTHALVDGLPGWNGGCFWPKVDLYSGNLFIVYNLLDVSALAVDWEFSVCYNSALGSELSSMGRGWRHSYDISLQVGVPGPGQITVHWGDGRRDVFTFDGVGWAAHGSLEGRKITSVAGGYILRNKHSIEHRFDNSGRLTSIRDRNGNSVLFTYDGFGRLIQIQDAV
jgi:YD repeat-containing protein